MKIRAKHIGYSPMMKLHMYRLLCDNGHADVFCSSEYLRSGEYEMPDALWAEGSGWADIVCDACGHAYHERCYIGMELKCPKCGHTEIVPEGAKLDSSDAEPIYEGEDYEDA